MNSSKIFSNSSSEIIGLALESPFPPRVCSTEPPPSSPRAIVVMPVSRVAYVTEFPPSSLTASVVGLLPFSPIAYVTEVNGFSLLFFPVAPSLKSTNVEEGFVSTKRP